LEFHREEPDCLWVTPLDGSVDFRQPEANPESQEFLTALNSPGITRLVMDLSQIPYFGSTMLEWFIANWKIMRERNGIMVLFCPTPIGLDVLKVVHFDQIIPIAESREEAQRLLRDPLPQNS
jgi:anti-anti-sigma factor